MSSINLGFLDFVALITFLVFAKAYWTKHLKPYGLPYPPGPIPLPLVGNIFDILNKNTWKTYAKWGKEYGIVIFALVLCIQLRKCSRETRRQCRVFQRARPKAGDHQLL